MILIAEWVIFNVLVGLTEGVLMWIAFRTAAPVRYMLVRWLCTYVLSVFAILLGFIPMTIIFLYYVSPALLQCCSSWADWQKALATAGPMFACIICGISVFDWLNAKTRAAPPQPRVGPTPSSY